MSKDNTKLTTILFILPNLNSGGSERVIVNIIRSLNCSEYNICLVLINKIGELIDLVPSEVKIVDLGIKRTRYSFFKMLIAIHKIKPEVIFSSTNRTNILLLATSYFFIYKSKIIIREPNSPYAQYILKKLPRYYIFLIKLLYHKANIVIAQTESMKNEINKYFKIPESKIKVITNPIDHQYIDSQLQSSKNPYPQEFVNVVASGRIVKQKGFDFLIKAFRRVVDENNNFRLYILGSEGDGKYKRNLVSLINELELNGHIFFEGFQSNPFVYYKYADLFVLSSRWEGLPNVVLESLYLNTPVVVTNCIPFFNEILVNGQNGYIVEFDNEKEFASRILQYGNLKVNSMRNINYNFSKLIQETISNEQTNVN